MSHVAPKMEGVRRDDPPNGPPRVLGWFGLVLQCGASMDHVGWLCSFANTFFQPLEEFPTSAEFDGIIARIRQQLMPHDDSTMQALTVLEDCEGGCSARWRRCLCFGSLDGAAEEWTPLIASTYFECVAHTSSLFHDQLQNVVAISDCTHEHRSVQLHAKGLPVNGALLDLLTPMHVETVACETGIDWAINCNGYCGSFLDQPSLKKYSSWTGSDPMLTLSFYGESHIIPEDLQDQLCEALKSSHLSVPTHVNRFWLSSVAKLPTITTLLQPDAHYTLSISESTETNREYYALSFAREKSTAGIASIDVRVEQEPLLLREIFGHVLVNCPFIGTLYVTPGGTAVMDQLLEASSVVLAWPIKSLGLDLGKHDPHVAFLITALQNPAQPVSKRLRYLYLDATSARSDDELRRVLVALDSIPHPLAVRISTRRSIANRVAPICADSMSASTVIPLPPRNKLAFLSILASKGIATRRNRVKSIFACAESVTHDVKMTIYQNEANRFYERFVVE